MTHTIFISLLLFSTSLFAQPKLFSSDWPVWNLTEGMNASDLLDSFDYQLKPYETSLRWFQAGNLDVTFMTLYDFIAMQPTKNPTIILGVTDYSNGGDKIVVRKGINTPADLKNKKILLSTNTVSLWLLHNFLAQGNLTLNDVEIVNQTVTLAPKQFKEDQSFSAIVGWNPNIDDSLDNNSYVITSSADFPDVIYDLMVAKQSSMKAYPVQINEFIINFYNGTNDSQIIKKTSQSLSVSNNEYETWLQDAQIFNTQKLNQEQTNKLLKNANAIKIFLSSSPTSLNHKDTLKKFRPRVLNLNKLFHYVMP